jgi:hypothetical protein
MISIFLHWYIYSFLLIRTDIKNKYLVFVRNRAHEVLKAKPELQTRALKVIFMIDQHFKNSINFEDVKECLASAFYRV